MIYKRDMEVEFTESAHLDLLYRQNNNPKKVERIKKLCEDIKKNNFEGIGKPEPLKYDLQGCWSRRIDRINRLVYKIDDCKLIVLACRYHY